MNSGSPHLTGMPFWSPLQRMQYVWPRHGCTSEAVSHPMQEHRSEALSQMPYVPAGQGLQLVVSSSCL